MTDDVQLWPTWGISEGSINTGGIAENHVCMWEGKELGTVL